MSKKKQVDDLAPNSEQAAQKLADLLKPEPQLDKRYDREIKILFANKEFISATDEEKRKTFGHFLTPFLLKMIGL